MTVILVVATILLFLGMDWLVRIRRQPVGVPAAVRGKSHPVRVRVPAGVFFARSHTWLSMYPSGKLLVGVDDFVNRLLDTPRVTLLKRAGEHVEKGEPMLRLESEGRSLTVRSPIEGEILTPNTELERRPELMHEDLFTEGWAYAVQPGRAGQMRQMLLGEETRRWVQEEFARLRDVFAGAGATPALGAVALQDGGPPVTGALKQLDQKAWARFEDEFLQVV